MKKSIRKFLALALCFMLVGSMTVMAYADSLTFTYNGSTYTAIFDLDAYWFKPFKFVEATAKNYDGVNNVRITESPGTYTRTVNYASTGDLITTMSYVEQLIEDAGLELAFSISYYQATPISQLINSGSTGRYAFAASVRCGTGSWSVYSGSMAGRAMPTGEGEISYAPTDTYTAGIYYVG